MRKRLQSTLNKIYPVLGVSVILLIWQVACMLEIVPAYMLPSPFAVFKAMAVNFPELCRHAGYSLTEAFAGLFLSVVLGFVFALLMDRFEILYKSAYPLAVITQTVPVVAIAPLLVLWFGYGMAPKVLLIVIVCFFPMTVSLLDGFRSVDKDVLDLFKAIGAKNRQVYIHAKIPSALPGFFSGLKMAVSYSIIGAVIAEWLGGNNGLGVYMTRVRKSYSYDKMFAVIFLVTIISLLLMQAVKIIEKKSMPWK